MLNDFMQLPLSQLGPLLSIWLGLTIPVVALLTASCYTPPATTNTQTQNHRRS